MTTGSGAAAVELGAVDGTTVTVLEEELPLFKIHPAT